MCPLFTVFAQPPEPRNGLLVRYTRDPAEAGTTRILLTGELSRATADQARDAIQRAQADARDVICDLAGVTFIDVNGMCVLLRLAARARHRGGLLTVRNPPLTVGPFLRPSDSMTGC
jgi:anti-anti-sigma factor